MAEALDPPSDAQHAQRRSSSQTSSSSRKSHRNKPARAKPLKRLSTSSTNTPTDLTSFPSLSPDASPEGFQGEPALNHALSQALLAEDHSRPNGDRGRKATLEGLTTSLPQISGRNALFSDSVTTRDVPGSLHLANDDHIERIIARTGAVKLVRQFARDLALRDAEISSIRLRADEREKELKKMLREAQISNQTIEHRLYVLENPIAKAIVDNTESLSPLSGVRRVSPTIDDMMSQAMSDDVGAQVLDSPPEDDTKGYGDFCDTIRPNRKDSGPQPRSSSAGSISQKRSSTALLRAWQGYVWGGATVSRKTSKTSSMMSDLDEQDGLDDFTHMQIQPGNRRKRLDEQLFQSLEEISPAFGPNGTGSTNPNNGDTASVNSRRSSKSFASWTVKLFAGNPHPGKEGAESASVRSRPSSTAPSSKARQSSASESSKPSGSAVAALKRLNSSAAGQTGSTKASSVRGSRANLSGVRRDGFSGPREIATPDSKTSDGNPTALGPVEMDPILPMESRPPTLTHIYKNYQPGEFLTDRFGFIYDQRRKKRQKGSDSPNNDSSRISTTEIISSSRSDLDLNIGLRAGGTESSLDSTTVEDAENSNIPTRRWQDYLKIATKPTELLSHTPEAGTIVSVSNAAEQKPRSSSVAVQKGGSISVVNATPHAAALMSQVVSSNAEFAGAGNETSATLVPVSEQEPVKLLLERLTELHDSLQRDRTVKWNEFLRKVRAERRKEGESSDRPSVSLAMPEVSLADGEIVGITGLGTKGKVGRAKWREFRNLVIGGIPVAYRAKIWSECSGASAMRVPGYYDDLVKGNTNLDTDPSVVSQIEMDIHRTLTDNVFFRKGPGVEKLYEVLLAYSRRNPDVGYCQGMNLIAGSLLLIMPTAEDAFWILASLIENILPAHYYDHGLLASRADQQILRQYVAEILPKLSAHLDELGIELEALTFQWFLSAFTDCLSAEALYRVWDVVFCLNNPAASATTAALTFQTQSHVQARTDSTQGGTVSTTNLISNPTNSLVGSAANSDGDRLANYSGGGGTFFFQVAMALLKLNEPQLLTTCSTPAEVYTYINHQMTNHAISIDGLIQASEALRNVIKSEDVCARRSAALRDMRADIMGGGYAGSMKTEGDSIGGTDAQQLKQQQIPA
ncbi:small G protein signaling modulator 3 [Histoplasma capsulatum var. duboisii H88]|uniref:Small G protein signaling modulator 3 n=2 Tax=Ajellomyces capsulatus TaxID=5037 RepID=F0UNY0_AJEC8|nr:small G-protein signaling modulator 3 [Histoplasma capsulatum H143]EGC47684.1 small G protein signaling modulator 3 [Histoplasma capsulatum var. duboisii H88]QSS53845.1 small G protein signaling modulator 3 [Histoplasma capsulatum var. duboisii H88]